MSFFQQGAETAAPDQTAAPDLSGIREELEKVAAEVSRIAQYRAKQAQRLASNGVNEARGLIESYPVSSVCAAFGAGALVAVALTSKPRRAVSRWEHRVGVTRADLEDFGDRMRRSVARAANNPSMTNALERVVEAVSSIDSKASISPAFEKLGSWLGALKTRAAATVNDIKS